MPHSFPWIRKKIGRHFRRISDDKIILRVFKKGAQAYVKEKGYEGQDVDVVPELWESYIVQLPEALKERAGALTVPHIADLPPQTVPRTFVEITKAALLTSMRVRLQFSIGLSVAHRGREDERLGSIKFKPNFQYNSVTLWTAEDALKTAFEDFLRDNELKLERSKFDFIFDYITPEAIYNKEIIAKCALRFINVFREDFLTILTDPEVKTALEVGEIPLSEIIKAISDHYAYYLSAYFSKKTNVDLASYIKEHNFIEKLFQSFGGDELNKTAQYNFFPSKEACSDMKKFVNEYVYYFKSGIRIMAKGAITSLEKERLKHIFPIFVGIKNNEDSVLHVAINSGLITSQADNIQNYISDDYDLKTDGFTETMNNKEILEKLLELNQDYLKTNQFSVPASYKEDEPCQLSDLDLWRSDELYQLSVLGLWEACISDESCPEWMKARSDEIRKIIIPQGFVTYKQPRPKKNRFRVVEDQDSPLTNEDNKALKIFSDTQYKELLSLEEKSDEFGFYKYRVHQLWEDFAKDQANKIDQEQSVRIRSKIATTEDPFPDIIFDNHLKDILVQSASIHSVIKDFAKVVEAVAIVWRYPSILKDESLKGSEKDWEEFSKLEEFKPAVRWMKAHPDYVYTIHQIYGSKNIKIFSHQENQDAKDRLLMIQRIIPEFLRVSDDPGVVSKLYKNSAVKIIPQLVLRDEINVAIKELKKKSFSENLEGVLLQRSAWMLYNEFRACQSLSQEIKSDNKILSNVLMLSFSGVVQRLEQAKNAKQEWVCAIVVTLIENIIAGFLKKFVETSTEGRCDDWIASIRELMEYDYGKPIDYTKFSSDLTQGFTTFVHDAFLKLKTSSRFLDIAKLVRKLISEDVFSSAIKDYLFNMASKEKAIFEASLEEVIKQDVKLFSWVIVEELSAAQEISERVNAILFYGLKHENAAPEIISAVSELLEAIAKSGKTEKLKTLTQIVYQGSRNISETQSVASSTNVSNVNTVNFVPLDEYDVNEEGLAAVLNKISHEERHSLVLQPIADIFNSDLAFSYRLRLIAGIAAGEGSRVFARTMRSSSLSKIYSALACFSEVSDDNSFYAAIESFKQTLNDDQLVACFSAPIKRLHAFLENLKSFEGWVKHFHQCFLHHLNQENASENFRKKTFKIIEKMERFRLNEWSIKLARMLQDFYAALLSGKIEIENIVDLSLENHLPGSESFKYLILYNLFPSMTFEFFTDTFKIFLEHAVQEALDNPADSGQEDEINVKNAVKSISDKLKCSSNTESQTYPKLSKKCEKLKGFWPSGLEEHCQLGDIICAQVLSGYVGLSWYAPKIENVKIGNNSQLEEAGGSFFRAENSLDQHTIDLAKVFAAWKAESNDFEIHPIALIYQHEKIVRCIEIYEEHGRILRNDCLASESTLLALAARKLPEMKQGGISSTLLQTIRENTHVSDQVLIAARIFPEFFDIILQQIQNSMRTAKALSLPSVLAFTYDPKVLLSCCNNNENLLIGFFVLSLIYDVIGQQKSPALSGWWLITLASFFDKFENIHKLSTVKIETCGLFKAFCHHSGSNLNDSDEIKKEIKALDASLQPCREVKKNSGSFERQKAYCAWFKEPRETLGAISASTSVSSMA